MAKTNFLSNLLSQGLSADDNALAITAELMNDDDLYKFFMKQAVLVLYVQYGKEQPTTKEVGEQMAVCINTAAHVLSHASGAYQDYLDRGDIAISEGMAHAVVAMGFQEFVKQLIFKRHFGDIFNKAE